MTASRHRVRMAGRRLRSPRLVHGASDPSARSSPSPIRRCVAARRDRVLFSIPVGSHASSRRFHRRVPTTYPTIPDRGRRPAPWRSCSTPRIAGRLDPRVCLTWPRARSGRDRCRTGRRPAHRLDRPQPADRQRLAPTVAPGRSARCPLGSSSRVFAVIARRARGRVARQRRPSSRCCGRSCSARSLSVWLCGRNARWSSSPSAGTLLGS